MRFPKLLIGLALLGVASGAVAQTAAAPAKKVTPPPPAPAKDVRFPAFEQKTLGNGLRVVVVEQHEQPAVSVSMVLKAGKVFEPEGKAGLAEGTASLLTQGTQSRSAQQIAEAIDFVGGALNTRTGIESGFADARVTSDQLDLGLELLADVTQRPSFPQEEIERWRRQSLSGLQVQQQDAGYLADAAMARLVFGKHPNGRPADGTPESIQGLTREDFVAFHKRHYLANNAILAVVGDVKPAEAFAKVEKYFGAWGKGEEVQFPTFEVPKRDKLEILVIDKPDAVQTEIRLGQVGLAFRDPDHHAADVYNSIVGDNANARLYEEIRRKRGLTYGANSFFLMGNQPGWFQVTTFTKTESTVEVVKVALDVLRGMQKEAVPQDELVSAKTFITGAFPLTIETPDGIAAQIVEAMKFGLGKEYIETYNDKVDAVTAADIQKFSQTRIQPDRMVVVLAGNAAGFRDALKKELGDFREIPAAELDPLTPDLRKAKTEKPAAAPLSGEDRVRGLTLAEQARQALGGKAFIEQRTQIAKGTGTLSPPGAPQAFPLQSLVIYQVFPDKTRSEFVLPMGTMIQTFDGTTGWASMMGQVVDQTEQLKESQFYGDHVLRRSGEPGWTTRPLPDEEVDGKKTQVIEISDEAGHATRFYLDPQSHLVVKTAHNAEGAKTETLYADYRPVSGVQVAHKMTVFQNGTKAADITFTEVQVNADVDPAVFKKPAS
ncbi:MAG TPA: insulinase family protein [Thermoanaerobaculia bacterium]|nr:insulinase family protein [Thermoanaerobaculia bacterium]